LQQWINLKETTWNWKLTLQISTYFTFTDTAC